MKSVRSRYFGRSLCLFACVVGLLPLAKSVIAQDTFTKGTTLLVGVDRRPQINLDGDWHYIPDPYGSFLYQYKGGVRDNGYAKNEKPRNEGVPIEYDFSTSLTLRVPQDWNTQKADLFRYEGPLWYERDIIYRTHPETRVFLHIGAANYRSVVWMNGHRACQHEGGFTPFDCEVTDTIHDGANFIVIAVDSTRKADGVPALHTDWYNYGGITRDISLIELPKKFVDDYDIHLENQSTSEISGTVHVVGADSGTEVQLAVPELNLAMKARCDAEGNAKFHLHPTGLQLWSPEKPKLYQVRMEAGPDLLVDEIGFRMVEVKGSQILLNGKPIFLKGISIHAEAPFRTGRVATDEDAQTLFQWVQELGANFVRLAHYPHDARMTRLADRLGVLVWSETPNWQQIDFSDPRVLQLAKQELTEMIRRDRNRASVILWSVANETHPSPERTQFLKTIVEETRRQDPTRLVTAAFLTPRSRSPKKTFDDPLGAVLDVIGMNEYIGWYEGKPEDAEKTQWEFAYQKPVIVSEFGAEAKAGFHGDPGVRWTEESQAEIYRHQLKMLENFPQLIGVSPWILMDFRSPDRNLLGLQDGFNRKGIVSDRGEKKLAFRILEEAYKSNSLSPGK